MPAAAPRSGCCRTTISKLLGGGCAPSAEGRESASPMLSESESKRSKSGVLFGGKRTKVLPCIPKPRVCVIFGGSKRLRDSLVRACMRSRPGRLAAHLLTFGGPGARAQIRAFLSDPRTRCILLLSLLLFHARRQVRGGPRRVRTAHVFPERAPLHAPSPPRARASLGLRWARLGCRRCGRRGRRRGT